MTTHVFIVDYITFKTHLEYLFAGTGAANYVVDFNNTSTTSLHHRREGMLIQMIADGSRVRCGDKIIFYLQQQLSKQIFEGKFFGIFRAKHDWSFLDNNGEQQYLKDQLNKSLTFRVLIEPHEVYAEGVTEWEALDEIKCLSSPNQMLWSLIYRKLKGNRGNTMVTIYEADRLMHLISNKNSRTQLNCADTRLSFDSTRQEIICLDEARNTYSGRQEEINLLPRLVAKYSVGQAFESHLQAYILKNIGKGINTDLDSMILNGGKIEWLGNEVSCGVGMQRIDIMLSVIQGEHKRLIPIELKAVEADVSNIIQITRYIDWIEQYYIPNRISYTQPVLVARQIVNKQSDAYQQLINSFDIFNQKNQNRCAELKYIEFYLDTSDLVFEEVPY